MKVAFVTPELDPLVRRTQISELARHLASALNANGAEVRVFLPRTINVDTSELSDIEQLGSVDVRDGDSQTTFKLVGAKLGALPVVLVEHPQFFANKHPYGNDDGPYTDNWRRYVAFSRAVLESFPKLDFAPDVLHGLDWTTGMIPLLQEHDFASRPDHPAVHVGTFFQICNLAMQGSFERHILNHVGLPLRLFQQAGGIELNGKVNFLKAGAEFATILCTHSSVHAQRIQQQDRGYGLEQTFARRSKELVGIASGIDYQAWDPSNDPHIAQAFSVKDKQLNGKKKCKTVLQETLKLDKGARTQLAVMIGRFDTDSGFELLAEILTSVLERNVEVVLMGSGHAELHDRLRTIETTFTGRCRVIEGYNNQLAHMLLAAADNILLPTHYHPGNPLCAIGLRYGALPIIYAQSGLEDYVVDINANARSGTGFHFKQFTGPGLLEGIDDARTLYKDADLWRTVVLRALRQDFSWQATAAEYLKAYRRVLRRTKPSKQTSS